MNPQNAHAHEDRLLDFAYGELPTPEARAMEEHLSGCVRCTQALDDIRGVRATMSQLSTEPAPDAGLESLMAYAQQAARRAAAGPAPRPSRWRRWLLPVVGLASVSTFGLFVLELQTKEPALTRPDLSQVAAKAERAKDAAPARGALAPMAASADAPATPPATVAQAAPAEEAERDKSAAKEVGRAEDWSNAGSGGGLDARIVREEELKSKRPSAKGAVERPRASTSQPVVSKPAPSKLALLDEKAAEDEEALAEAMPRDLPKQDAMRLGGAASAADDDAAYGSGVASAPAPEAGAAYAPPAEPPAPAARGPASPARGREDVATGALVQSESLAERRAPAPAQAPSKKAKRAAPSGASAALPPPGVRAEPGPSVEELSRQAQEAYRAGDRALEAGLLRSAIAAGASGSERLGLLNRLCDAELILGRQAAGAAACKQVMTEAPGTSAAQAARRRLAREPSSLESAPESAEPSK